MPKYSKVESAVQNSESVADAASQLALGAKIGEVAASRVVPSVLASLGKSVPAALPQVARSLGTAGSALGVAAEVPAILWGVDAVRAVSDPELRRQTKEATKEKLETAAEPGNYLSALGDVVSSAIQRPTSTLSALAENISDAYLDQRAAEEEIKLRRNALALAQRQILQARGPVPEVKMGDTREQDIKAASKFFGRFAPAK